MKSLVKSQFKVMLVVMLGVFAFSANTYAQVDLKQQAKEKKTQLKAQEKIKKEAAKQKKKEYALQLKVQKESEAIKRAQLEEQAKVAEEAKAKEDAKRDYEIGNYISSKGILTNEMEAIIEITDTTFKIKKTSINPILLQYTVKCPYRLCDAAFMNQNQIKSFIYNK